MYLQIVGNSSPAGVIPKLAKKLPEVPANNGLFKNATLLQGRPSVSCNVLTG